jgi:hypothetical protein
MGKREPLLGIAIGRKGVGKTYATLDMIQSYLKGNPQKGIKPRKVLILDVNNEFGDVKADQNPEFEHIRAIRVEDVKRFSLQKKVEARRVSVLKPDGGGNMSLNELAEALHVILRDFKNGLLLVEDITKFVSDSLPSDLIGMICTLRHVAVDVVIHFQTVGKAATPKLWGNCNWLRFHKCDDTVERHKNKFAGELDHLKLLEKMVNMEYEKGNKRFFAFLNKDDGKIQGTFTRKQFQYAVYKYLEDNYSKVMKPKLNEIDISTGKKKYENHDEVLLATIKDYTTKYYGN